MAKIVAVHGTFASGPLEGRKWWQRGSDFTRRLSQLVEAEDGPLTIQPYVRDGQNSETSRRRAGQKLYEKLKALEVAKTRYVVIGHSHGRSVISCALLQASYEKTSLVSLQRWVSVGAPFIKTERPRLLFSRLGLAAVIPSPHSRWCCPPVRFVQGPR